MFGGNIQVLAAPNGTHCGSPRSSLARSTTWPPPAPTLCPPCTGPPPSCTCPPGRRRLPRRRRRRPPPRHQTRPPPLPRPPPRPPHLQPAPARPTRPRRTRGRRTHPTLAHPQPHHPQPQPHRQHRPRHSRPQQQLEIEIAEKTSVYRLPGLSLRAATFVVELAVQHFVDWDAPAGRPKVLAVLAAVRLTLCGCAATRPIRTGTKTSASPRPPPGTTTRRWSPSPPARSAATTRTACPRWSPAGSA